MNFDPDEDDLALITSVRSLLRDRYDPATRRAGLGSGTFSAELWTALAQGLGLVPMVLPEKAGGDGAGAVAAGFAVRETGSALYDGPYLSCVTASSALALSETDAAAAVLERIVTGEARPTPALLDDRRPVTAVRTESGWRLDGQARGVLDAGSASHLVTAARTSSDDFMFFLVDARSPGYRATTVRGFDLLRSVGTIDLEGVPGEPLAEPGTPQALRLYGDIVDRALILLASEQVGGARAALDLAVGYARERQQFGKVIGSFQAVKHQCADVLVAVETAEAAVDHVLCLLDAGEPTAELAPMAQAMASDAYTTAALTCLHVHGGIGFTWEHDTHLHVRRAKAASLLLGSPARQRELVLERLGL